MLYVSNYGKYNAQKGVWNIGNLPNGALATLIIKCILDQGLGFTNTAIVSSSSYDPNLSNNMVSLTKNYLLNNIINEKNFNDEKLIPMQKTGIPIIPLFMGIIIIMGGFIITRRK
jgi:predicted transporter